MSEVRFYTKSVRSMECACNTGDNLQTVLSGQYVQRKCKVRLKHCGGFDNYPVKEAKIMRFGCRQSIL